ncbi:cellulase family glycosylhydrolase [Fulvivirga maritima]|uniref:cellulase family glycosylhydrolase n=1 Tax=Fulvivirga maritima TaxID=2904247 RepID=UPI001F4461D8|nr:cellulase family glycosylhydrolase [Fulvivirga maritima]UII26690.1 cellulase family glycosylhydrolase [Fulvivirga maritima]
MKKQIILCCSILLITFFYDAKSQGFLQAHQGRIIDSNSGEEVLWRGMGLGGWMLQEGYMLETGGPQFQIQRRITELIGEDKKNEFYDAWLANHMQEIDVDSLSSWGFNMIRLPMHYNLFTPPIEEETNEEITWLNKGFELTDNLLQWCKTHNVYLILDLHATPGGQGENADINDYDPTKPSLWESEANKAKMVALWRKLAERYADEPMIAAYDIINEPNWGFQDHAGDPNGCSESENTELWDLQKEVTEAIREVDQNHIVIIEGNCWGNNYAGLPELWDDNMVVSYHKYWNANDVGAIQGMLDMRNDRNVPIWLGETGENSNTWFTNAVQLFEENDMGWSWWPLKKTGGNNPLQIHKGEGYQQVIDYWNGAAEAPSETEAYEGLMQFAENTKLENCEYRKDVVDALIRQPHTNETKPFKSHDLTVGDNLLIYAVDYDLGKNGYAYYDVDASNTSGTSGGASWNSGGQYRNAGVDIEGCSDELTNGYNVGWTMPEEWLQYTINVEEEGSYHVSFRVASPSGLGKVKLYANDVKVSETITMPNTGDYQAWSTITVEGIHLNQGEQKLKLLVEEGDFNFNYIEIEGPFDVTEQPKILEKKAINQKKE